MTTPWRVMSCCFVCLHGLWGSNFSCEENGLGKKGYFIRKIPRSHKYSSQLMKAHSQAGTMAWGWKNGLPREERGPPFTPPRARRAASPRRGTCASSRRHPATPSRLPSPRTPAASWLRTRPPGFHPESPPAKPMPGASGTIAPTSLL